MLPTPVEALTSAMDLCDEQLRQAPDMSKPEQPKSTTTSEPTEKLPPPMALSAKDVEAPTWYVPRVLKETEFGGMTDLKFVSAAREADLAVLLYGPPGTGKTSLVMAAIPECYVLAGTSETETADFVGSWVQRTDGSYAWVDGPLVKAMDEGKPILVDEIAVIDPRTLAVLYSAMDGRNKLYITANPDRGEVEAKPGFLVFGACNPDAPGAIMSDALLSRFQLHVEVLTDWATAKTLGVGTKIVTVARNLAKRQESNEILVAPQLRELVTYRDIVMVYGEVVALRNFISQARETDRPIYAEVAGDVFGYKLASLTI